MNRTTHSFHERLTAMFQELQPTYSVAIIDSSLQLIYGLEMYSPDMGEPNDITKQRLVNYVIALGGK